MDDAHDRYMFRMHSRDELGAWARSLTIFRFCRAYGGHNNDGDRLAAALSFSSADEFGLLCDRLGFAPQGEPRESIFGELRQPGHVHIADVPVFVWFGEDHRTGSPRGRLAIHVSNPESPYEVSADTVKRALAVEPLLAGLADHLLDPPQDDANCVCPKYYPDFWS